MLSHRVATSRPAFTWFITGLITLMAGCGGSSREPAAQRQPGETAAESEPQDLATQLAAAVAARQWSQALKIGPQAMIAHPNDPDVLTNIAVATAQSGDRDKAASLMVDAVVANDYSTTDRRIDNALRALFDVGQIYDAIELLQKTLEKHPDASFYRRQLVGFLGEVQQTKTIPLHMRRLIEERQFDLPLLLATTEMTSRRFSMESIETMVDRNPDDLRPRLAEARYLLDGRDTAGSESILRDIIERHPDFAPAHSMLGLALATQGKLEAIPQWLENVPAEIDQYPGYWIAIGQWAAENGRVMEAIGALARATRLSPNDSAGWTRLGSAIRAALDSENVATELSEVDWNELTTAIDRRRDLLIQLREQFSDFKSDGEDSQAKAVMVAQTLADLGRYWESEAWLALAMRMRKDRTEELSPLRQQVIERLKVDREWQSLENHPELAFNLTSFPVPDLAALRSPTDRTLPRVSQPHPIRLRNEAESRGIQFYGRVGNEVRGPRVPIAQTLGCGGGTIDFDLDGRHDLVFTAAGGTVRESNSDPGALYRNHGETLVDVSQSANVSDTGYGHGVVVGDINDDGFQDLLMLNFGKNRLLQNNGDGTFSDVSDQLGEQAIAWNTSGAIADLDGDGFNDIFVARYCAASEPVDQPCFDAAGNEINCYPLRFRAAKDQFLKGSSDGQFTDVSDRWIGETTPGRGLGVVAGKLDGRSQHLYVVHDASANHLYRFRPSSADSDSPPELGIVSGLALDGQSFDQGSMGIATADLDNDGDLDFYVTGFSDEYNILYQQQSPGFWSDRSGAAGLVSPTLQTVGFGTEAVDFDNDGLHELIVTNGHIGEFGGDSPPLAQPMQMFRRGEANQFDEIDLSNNDEYFQHPHVGRALFTCDINSDSVTDVVVTHSTEPVALLVNHSESPYQQIRFRLVATEAARDGVGAVVELQLAGNTRRLYRVSGDGYLCSNQPELVIGAGSEESVQEVIVTWPDGTREEIGDLETGATYIVIQGQDAWRQ